MATRIFITLIFLLPACSNNFDDKLFLTGTIEAIEVNVSSKVTGEVTLIKVDEGDKVSVGDTLALIDPSEYILQYQQALAAEKVAEAQYLLLFRGSRKEDIKQAEENLKQAEASYKNAKDDYERIQNLFSTGSVSSKQFDDARTRYEIAEAQLNSARQVMEKLKTGARQEEIDAAKARFEQATAQTKLIQKKISDCTILSPISGYITKRILEKGELVNYGTPIVRISNLDELYVMVYLPETNLPKIKLGNPAEIKVDAFPDRKFSGNVVYISPEAEFTPKNIQTKEERVKLVFGVKIKIPNEDHLLKVGLPADVVIQTR